MLEYSNVLTPHIFSIAYGTKTFREVEVPDKMISSDPFKTVFNRIPEFDQLGESYS